MLNCPLCGTDAEDHVPQCRCGFVFRSSGPLGHVPTIESSPHARHDGQTRATPLTSNRAEAPPPPALPVFGWISTALGLALMFYGGLIFDPTIESSGMYGIVSRINNIGLQQTQLIIFLAGCSFFVVGAALLSASAITKAIRETKSAEL